MDKGRPEVEELAHLVAHLEEFDWASSEGVPDGGRDSLPQNVDHTQEEELPALTVEESGYWRIEVADPDLQVVQSAAGGGEFFLLRVINILRDIISNIGNAFRSSTNKATR